MAVLKRGLSGSRPRQAAGQPQHAHQSAYPRRNPARAVASRLRVLAVLGAVLVMMAMLSAYVVTDAVMQGVHQMQSDRLTDAIASALAGVPHYEQAHLKLLNLVRGTNGVPQLVLTGDGRTLQQLVEPLAANAGINSVIVADRDGVEVLGLQRATRVDAAGGVDYTVSEATDLSPLPMVSDFLGGGADMRRRPSGLALTPQGYALFTAAPVLRDGQFVGVALVGSTLKEVAAAVRANALTELAIFLPNGDLAATTLTNDASGGLRLDAALARSVHGSAGARLETTYLNGLPYMAAYAPFKMGGEALGVLGVYVPNGLFTATEASRHALSLAFAGGAASLMIAGFLALTLVYTQRLAQVKAAADALRRGDLRARTHMEPSDEVGALGHAVDTMADSIERRMEFLALSLQAQRRETSRLSAVLDSVPDGLIVQDLGGRVMLMNDAARRLLGSRRVFRDSSLNRLTALVTDTLGAALAPGVYALGEPLRVEVNDHVLRVQAAAVMEAHARTTRRIGTVVVLRDVTAQARLARQRERLIDQMARQVYEPLATLQRAALTDDADGYSGSIRAFVEGLRENMISLERIILEMRDLSTMDRAVLQVRAYPLPVEELVWGLLRDWQEVIDRAGLRVHVMLMDRDMFILGDERRLRWAIGNVIDNAVKYTPAGGEIGVVAATGNDSEAVLTISDSGVGISADDMPFIGQRFFRGKPRTPDGRLIRVPGTGQGLYIARRVLEAHGGRLDVESWPGVGTDIRLTLPLVVPEPVQGWPGAATQLDTGRYSVDELESLRATLDAGDPAARPAGG